MPPDLIWRAIAVCASSLPFTDAPVFTAIIVLPECDALEVRVDRMVTAPATCQKMFFAQRRRGSRVAFACQRSCHLKIQTSVRAARKRDIR